MSRVVGTDAAGVEAAAAAVRLGGVIVYPTETVYGLGGDAGRPDVVARVLAAKGRDADKPVLVLTDEWTRVADWFEDQPVLAPLMAHEPPLAVTLLLRAAAAAPVELVGAAGLVGVRRTADPFCRELVRAADAPLLSTSANAAGAPAPALFADIAPAILATADVAVDAGRRLPGTPSTVVRVEAGRAVVVRAGAVDADTIERVCAGRG